MGKARGGSCLLQWPGRPALAHPPWQERITKTWSFEVTTQDGRLWRSKKVVLATGGEEWSGAGGAAGVGARPTAQAQLGGMGIERHDAHLWQCSSWRALRVCMPFHSKCMH